MERRALTFDSLIDDITHARDLESFASDNLGHISMETIFKLADRLSRTDVDTANRLLDTAAVQARVSTPCMKMEDGSFVPLPPIWGHMSHAEFNVKRTYIPNSAKAA